MADAKISELYVSMYTHCWYVYMTL